LILLQVENLNLATNLEDYYFNAMLIACKCMPLCKKMDYNAKNEALYLTTTHLLLISINLIFEIQAKGKITLMSNIALEFNLK
jgi:hypothetical protein